jgi:hypothetical protein
VLTAVQIREAAENVVYLSFADLVIELEQELNLLDLLVQVLLADQLRDI